MRLMQQNSMKKVVSVLVLLQASWAFQAPPSVLHRHSMQRQAALDPNDITSITSCAAHMDFQALLSTMLATAMEPAHGHSNPLFGPPDPYLQAGKSIAPSIRALTDMGVATAQSAGEMVPKNDVSPEFQEAVKSAMAKGWKILDDASIKETGAKNLPGFAEIRGIFGSRMEPAESPESFAAEVKWAAGYMNVMDKLPLAAFFYVLVEFFVLRPGVDLYKEEVESDPMGAMADTIAVGGVRIIAISIVAFFTLIFFG